MLKSPETKRGCLQTHHQALQSQLSLSFSALAVGWHPSFSSEEKSQSQVKDELWRCRPCCCCSPTALKECWLQHQTSRVSSLVLKLSQLGTHPSLLCHSLAVFINCCTGTYRCSAPPQTELEHSRSVPVCALEVVFLSSCFVLNPTKLAIPKPSHSGVTSSCPLNAV